MGQADLCEFDTSLVYRVSSRTAKGTQRSPVLKTQKKKKKEKKKNINEESPALRIKAVMKSVFIGHRSQVIVEFKLRARLLSSTQRQILGSQ